jgi:hypothetical protein
MRQHFYNLWSQHVRKKVIGERKRRIKVNPQEVDGQWLTFPFPYSLLPPSHTCSIKSWDKAIKGKRE